MSSQLRIIVTGLIAQHPTLGGVTWDYLQYALGLMRLGHDVYYFEDSGQWPYKHDGGASGNDWIGYDPAPNVNHLAEVMSRYGLGDRWAYRFPTKSQWFGLSDQKRKAVIKTADMLINVSGTLEHPEQYRQIKRMVYIDSDPVFTQIKCAQGSCSAFRRRVNTHDVHFSFGECLSDRIPATGHRWLKTRTPIVLSEWHPETPTRNVFTTVMSWTSYKPLIYKACIYSQKDVELHRFLALPSHVSPAVLEAAMDKTQHVNWQTGVQAASPEAAEFIRTHPQWTPQDLLSHMGWQVRDALQICPDLDSYRRYIETSKAEWSVAKNGYVQGKPGWFSCRSACYLAAGRPVVVQDTGFASVLPVGEGILPFQTFAEAVAAIQEAELNYTRHAMAARAIAEDYFDSNKVLNCLIEEAMHGNAACQGGVDHEDSIGGVV